MTDENAREVTDENAVTVTDENAIDENAMSSSNAMSSRVLAPPPPPPRGGRSASSPDLEASGGARLEGDAVTEVAMTAGVMSTDGFKFVLVDAAHRQMECMCEGEEEYEAWVRVIQEASGPLTRHAFSNVSMF